MSHLWKRNLYKFCQVEWKTAIAKILSANFAEILTHRLQGEGTAVMVEMNYEKFILFGVSEFMQRPVGLQFVTSANMGAAFLQSYTMNTMVRSFTWEDQRRSILNKLSPTTGSTVHKEDMTLSS